LNVPLNNKKILNDFRLRAIQPTLNFLLAHQAHTIIVTHIGRPKDQEPALSTQLLMPWFTKHEYPVIFAHTIEQAARLLQTHQLVLLENIRFWPDERTGGTALAHALRGISDIFVQDAFGVLHRDETSITLLPTLYPEKNRTIGLLVERELGALNKILHKPQKPVFAIIGGAKIATKLPLVKHLLTIADIIALLPPLSFSIAHAHGQSIGTSLVDTTCKSMVRTLLSHARTEHKHIFVPTDYVVSRTSWAGPYHTIAANQFQPHDMGITIGPQTVALYRQHIAQAKTIFFNGVAGDLSYKRTCAPMHALFETLCKTRAYSVVAGGDSLAMLEHYKLDSCVSYCSSGGGSTITYLSGEPLIGLKPFTH
jgi:phosphoglycerate kinase